MNPHSRQPGHIFQKITGRPVTFFSDMRAIYSAIETARGHKIGYLSGGIFPVGPSMGNIDQRIDALLKNRQSFFARLLNNRGMK